MPDRLRSRLRSVSAGLALLVLLAWPHQGTIGAQTTPATKPPAPKSLRLYIFDCGLLTSEPSRDRALQRVTPEELVRRVFRFRVISSPIQEGRCCGTLGSSRTRPSEAAAQGARSDVNPTVAAVVTRTLKSQLAQIEYKPADITYFAISHAHIDHTANMNQFAASTWLARPAERAFMWQEEQPAGQSFFLHAN